jgi:ABC-type nitrate/sulfonate/bicarbonate transport system permease component
MSASAPTLSGGSGKGRTRVIAWVLRIASLAAFLAAWEWYGQQGSSFAIAPATDVLSALWSGIVNGTLVRAAVGTIQTMVVGYLIAVVIGVGGGVLIAVSRWAANTLEPLALAAYATPMALLIPVIGIYIGLGFQGRVFLVVVWCVFEILINTITGVREVPPNLIETARSFGIGRWAMYRKVVLPAAFPFIIVGLRLGVGRAIRGAVTAEVLLSVTNLGKIMVSAGSTFDMPQMLAGIFFVMLLGYALMWVAEFVEGWVLAWRNY